MIIIGGILLLFMNITRLVSNEIFSPTNKIHRAKNLSAALYSTPVLWRWANTQKFGVCLPRKHHKCPTRRPVVWCCLGENSCLFQVPNTTCKQTRDCSNVQSIGTSAFSTGIERNIWFAGVCSDCRLRALQQPLQMAWGGLW